MSDQHILIKIHPIKVVSSKTKKKKTKLLMYSTKTLIKSNIHQSIA